MNLDHLGHRVSESLAFLSVAMLVDSASKNVDIVLRGAGGKKVSAVRRRLGTET